MSLRTWNRQYILKGTLTDKRRTKQRVMTRGKIVMKSAALQSPDPLGKSNLS